VDKDQMQTRTKAFALSVMRFTGALPRGRVPDIIARQLLRSATSVGANYRSACLAKSRADFVAKMGTVAEESDESRYWMELLLEGGICDNGSIQNLMQEASELTSIVVASIKTARSG
jgi:four helix bundle protein